MIRSQLIAILTVTVIMPAAASGDPSRQMEDALPVTTPAHEPFQTTDQNHALEAGWRAYQEGRVSEALAAYQEAVKAAPNDASLWYDLGCLYALNHDLAMARSALQQALSLHPQLAAAHDAMGQLHEQEADVSGALTWYERADALQPGTTKFLRHLIRARLRLHDTEAARPALQQLLIAEPADAEARYQLGVLELRANAPDLAIHHFQKLLEHTPTHVMAWNGLALAYARIGEFGEASTALEKARLLQPDNASTQTNAGIVAAYQQRWEEARRAWQRALELDPECSPASHNLEALNALTSPSSP